MIKNSLKVHFVGVLGCGMRPVAKLLLLKGFSVSGSDVNKNDKLQELLNLGLSFKNNHDKTNVDNADIVIYSSAISSDNPEILNAKKLNKAIYSRVEVLSVIVNCYKKSIGVCGTHGKTTTTALFANLTADYGINSTAIIGGIDNRFNDLKFSKELNNIIVEVCEFDKNIQKISTNVSVCLNIDNDHLDCYNNLEGLKQEFFKYLDKSKYKFINLDDKNLKEYKGKRVTTFGIDTNAEFMAKNLTSISGKYSFDLYEKGKFITNVKLNLFGKHNVYNALAVISVLRKIYKVNVNKLGLYLQNFTGVKGRFEHMLKYKNKEVYVDYAHHPTEIECLLKTIKERFDSDYLLVFQPHTYSRTRLLFNDFLKVFKGEKVIFYKEYKAREEYDEKSSSFMLSKKVKNSEYYEDIDKLLSRISKCKKKNVIIVGAGDLANKIINK